MQPLPEQFNTSSNDSADTDADYEPINAGKRESASRFGKSAMPTTAVIALAVFISCIVNASVMIAVTDRPLAKIATLFGQKLNSGDETDPRQIAIDQLNTVVAQHSEYMTSVSSSLQSLHDEVDSIKGALTENESQITRLKSQMEETAGDVSKIKIQIAKPKPVANVKPKVPPKPQVFVSLVSIRSQGGSEWVTLRDGIYVSPLMATGDEWRSVKLVAADTNTKSAQILVNGAVTVVRL